MPVALTSPLMLAPERRASNTAAVVMKIVTMTIEERYKNEKNGGEPSTF